MIHWAPESSSRAQNTLVKALYLKRLKNLLKSSPQSVIDLLEKLRKSLLTFSNMRVVVSADVIGLKDPVSAWKPLVQSLDTKEPLDPLIARKTVLSDAARNPGKLAYIVPMSTIDSSFGYLTARGIEGFDHPRLPALMVAAAYLDAVEGPLWTAVRGTGLAYGSNFSYSSSTGVIGFSIYRSPDAFKAYEAARNVVTAYADGSIPFDKYALEGAVSSIVVQFANEQTTIIKAALVSFINLVVLGIPKDYGTRILKKVREVQPEDVRAAMKDLVLPVFLPGKADLTITCASIMTEVRLLVDLDLA
jgi:Zn-dependent M16 (insulinase) family peptidase